MVAMERTYYSNDEISEIIKIAADIEGRAELDRAILERTAEELGISPEAIRQAEEEFRKNRELEVKRQEDLVEQKLFKRYKWQEFYEHLASYVAVNGFLFFLDYRKDSELNWFWFPLLGWGIGMLIHFASMFRTFGNDEMDKEFVKWRRARHKRLKGKRE